MAGVAAKDSKEYTVDITISDKGDGTLNVVKSQNSSALNFTNTYDASGEAEIKVQKNLVGRAWTTEDSFEFTLTAGASSLKDEKGNAIASPLPEGLETVTITSETENYTDTFGKIKYTSAGTYTYTVSEAHKGETIKGVAYDDQDKTITIEVVDDGEGNLVAKEGDTLVKTAAFTNTYNANGTAQLSATKKANKNLGNRTFTFELLDADNPRD